MYQTPTRPGLSILTQALLHKRANYVANTGFGWGLKGALGLEEQLIRLYTRALLEGGQSSMGKALSTAKQQYFLQATDMTGYDEKILEELTFYGLPMYQIVTGNAFGSTDNPFPSVQMIANLPGSFGTDTVTVGSLDIDLVGSLSASQVMSETVTMIGNYYSLDGSLIAAVDNPLQPSFYASITIPNMPTRSIVWLGGQYEKISQFQPLVAAPVNEYVSNSIPAELDPAVWYPAMPVGINNLTNIDHLISQFGQFNLAGEEQRLFKSTG